MQFRNAQVFVDLNAIHENMIALKKHVKDQTKILAVVKANAYGHGAIEVANQAIESGADGLCVAILEEAVELREAGIACDILVMGWTPPEGAATASHYGITLTVFQESWLDAVYSQRLKQPIAIHLKLDTGMGRLGIVDEAGIKSFLAKLDDQYVQLTGVFTHFAQADEKEDGYFHYQHETFKSLIQPIKERFPTGVLYHTGNSAASMQFPDKMFDAVRYGIGLYGLYPSVYLTDHHPFELTPALSVTTALVHVKKVNKGEKISYGLTYEASEDEWIGTLPIGYADGIQRGFQDFYVLVRGKQMRIVGRVCMDQTMIKLDQSYPLGEKVTLVGHDLGASITLEEVAEHLGTINYEVSCLLTNRLPRHYVKKKNL